MRSARELHPEFGFFWPSLVLRRNARLGLTGAAVGAAFAAAAIVALTVTPGSDSDIALVGAADAAVPSQPSSGSGAGAGSTARAAQPCDQQTWPYIESKCLPRSGTQKTVRVLPPDAPSQTELVATKGAAAANAAKIKGGQSASSDKQRAQDSRTRQRNRDAEDVPERAYATPYQGRRIQPQRREWHSW